MKIARTSRLALPALAVAAILVGCSDSAEQDRNADAEQPAERVVPGTQPTVEQENQRPQTSTGGEIPRQAEPGTGG